MSHWYNVFMENAPFLAATIAQPKMSVTRVIEALIIAAITAFATSYITVAKLEARTELRAEYSEKQFVEQVRRRDIEIAQIKVAMKEDAVRQQVQYETLRAEIQRVAIAIQARSR